MAGAAAFSLAVACSVPSRDQTRTIADVRGLWKDASAERLRSLSIRAVSSPASDHHEPWWFRPARGTIPRIIHQFQPPSGVTGCIPEYFQTQLARIHSAVQRGWVRNHHAPRPLCMSSRHFVPSRSCAFGTTRRWRPS